LENEVLAGARKKHEKKSDDIKTKYEVYDSLVVLARLK
jgi:hypothetical protein